MSKLIKPRNFDKQILSGFPMHLTSSDSSDPFYSKRQELLKDGAQERKNSISRVSLLKTLYEVHIKRKDGKLFIPNKEELMAANPSLCKDLIEKCGSARSERYTFVITKLKEQYPDELEGLNFSHICYDKGFTPKKAL